MDENESRQTVSPPALDVPHDVPHGLDEIERAVVRALGVIVEGNDQDAKVAGDAFLVAITATRMLYAAQMQALRSGLAHAQGLLNDPDGALHGYAWLELAVQNCLEFRA